MSKRSGLILTASLALGFWTASTPTSVVAADSGWWVVLGSVASPDNNFTPQVEVAVRRIEAATRRCGLTPTQDFSSKFRNFTPGYTVVVVGAFLSRGSADRALARARGCLPGAYVKQGSYSGE